MKEFPWWGYLLAPFALLLVPLIPVALVLVGLLWVYCVCATVVCEVFDFERPWWIDDFMDNNLLGLSPSGLFSSSGTLERWVARLHCRAQPG